MIPGNRNSFEKFFHPGSFRLSLFKPSLIQKKRKKSSNQDPKNRTPKRILITDFIQYQTGIIGPQHVEPAGKYKPKPSHCSSQLRFWRIVSDPDQESIRSEEHTSELQSRGHLVCRLLLEKK